MKPQFPSLELFPLHSSAPPSLPSFARDFLEPAVLDFVSFLSLIMRAGYMSGRLWAASSMRLIEVLSNKS